MNETNRIANEKQLRSICELIDKISIDFGSIIYKYVQRIKIISSKKSIKLIDLIEEELEETNNPEKIKLLNGLIELARKLKNNNLQITGPLISKIFDFLSYVDTDIKLSIQVIDYFRKYYGQTHLRLAQKLYLTALLIEEKDCHLRKQLLNESLKIAQKITPTINQIKQATRSRQQINLINNYFLNEIEKQLFISKNSIQIDRKMFESRGPKRHRSASRNRIISLSRFSIY